MYDHHCQIVFDGVLWRITSIGWMFDRRGICLLSACGQMSTAIWYDEIDFTNYCNKAHEMARTEARKIEQRLAFPHFT